MEGIDPGAITDGLSALTLIGLVGLLIRLSFNAYSERAKVSETREATCVEKLQTCVASLQETTTALREAGAAATEAVTVGKRIEAQIMLLGQRWEPIERSITELLDHARRGQ